MTPVAAIDCGTNSTRLLIVDDEGRSLRRLMRITRLGQGVDATGVLRDDAVARTLDVLREYHDEMTQFGASSGRLAATSAARDAANGAAFLREATATTGLAAELLSGEEEGRLSFEGATADLDSPIDDVVVVDIGGGSTELVTMVDGEVRAHSMQIGCVRVTERTLGSDPPTHAELAAASDMIEASIDAAFDELPTLGAPSASRRVVGLAGTVSTLAMVDLALVEYDEARLHHHWLSLAKIRSLRDTLASETYDDHRRRPGMVAGREDVITAGACILEAVVRRLGAPGCLSSEHDILDGLAQSALQK